MYLGSFSVFMVSGFVLCQSNHPPTLSIAGHPLNYVSVPENTVIGHILFTLTATDLDADSLTFSIESPDATEFTTLRTTRMTSRVDYEVDVVLKEKLNAEHGLTYKRLRFAVSDGRIKVYLESTLFITDVNDNPPRFTGLPYNALVQEDALVGTIVFTVKATDPDFNANKEIIYQLRASNPDDNTEYLELFGIDSRLGNIILKKHLDFMNIRSFYHFKVSARDNGNPPCPGIDCLCDEGPQICNPDPVDLIITVEQSIPES